MPMEALLCFLDSEGGVKSSHSMESGKHSQDSPACTCCPDILCPLLLLRRLRVGLCCGMCRNVQRHPESPCQGAAKAPLPSAWLSQKHCFQLGPCLCCHFKNVFWNVNFSQLKWFPFCPLTERVYKYRVTQEANSPVIRLFCSHFSFPQKHNGELYQCSVICFLLNTSD